MELFDLSERVAVVTGGNGGIGLGMAEGLAAAGARILVVGRDREKNATAVRRLRGLGPDAQALAADLTDDGAAADVSAAAEAAFGRLDILVNNAGGTVRGMPQDLSVDDWRWVMETNLTSAFRCSQAAYPLMQRAGGGKVINIGSMFSLFGAPYSAAYAASKGGIVQLTKVLATAWAADGIQVNAVLPGWIETELTRQAREEVPGLYERQLARMPAGRWGMPQDHAGIAVFLASRASDYVTGVSIPVDGGFSISG